MTMKRSAERGFTLVEVMIVVAIIALLAAIAIPNVLRGRTTANETSAIGNIRALFSSLEMYRSVQSVYPQPAPGWQVAMYEPDCTIEAVPTPDFGPPSFCGGMAGQTVQGYLYTYTGVASGATFTLVATPVTFNNTGTRAFRVTEAGLIQHCTTIAQGQVPDGAGDNTIDQVANNCP